MAPDEEEEKKGPEPDVDIPGEASVSLVKILAIAMAAATFALVFVFELRYGRFEEIKDSSLALAIHFVIGGGAIALTAVGVFTLGAKLNQNMTYIMVMIPFIVVIGLFVIPVAVMNELYGGKILSQIAFFAMMAIPFIIAYFLATKVNQMEERPTLGIYFMIFGLMAMIAFVIDGTSGDPDYENLSNLHANNFMKLFIILLIGIVFLWYLEMSHASFRFHKILTTAKGQRATELDLGAASGNYFMWSGFLMLIVLMITFGVLMLHRGFMHWVSHGGIFFSGSPKFAESIIFNSIYSVAIIIAIIFIPLAIILAFLFGEGSLIKSTRTIVLEQDEKEDEYADLMAFK